MFPFPVSCPRFLPLSHLSCAPTPIVPRFHTLRPFTVRTAGEPRAWHRARTRLPSSPPPLPRCAASRLVASHRIASHRIALRPLAQCAGGCVASRVLYAGSAQRLRYADPRGFLVAAHICAGTRLATAHICAGTRLAAAHICAGTGLLTPSHICAGTGFAAHRSHTCGR